MLRPVSIVFLIAVFAAGAVAKQKPKHHGKDLPSDRAVIVEYYRGSGGLPPGLAKRHGDLPPGLEKQLRRNGQLPPGLQRRLQPFPADLERRLAPIPPDCERGFLGRVAVVWNRRTSVIVDVIRFAD